MAEPFVPTRRPISGLIDKSPKIENVPAVKKAQANSALDGILNSIINVASLPVSVPAAIAQTALTYSPDAEAVIRPGGDASLNLWHNMSKKLGSVIETLKRGSITNPSVGIDKNNIFGFSDSPTLVFNPTSPLFDPAIASSNKLYARDAYTSRTKQPFNSDVRLKGESARFTENAVPTDLSQILSIIGSPEFRSFKEFERAGSGAKLLGRQKEQQTLIDATEQAIEEMLGKDPIASGMSNRKNSMEWIKYQALEKKNPDAIKALQLARHIPSDYAELKVIGEVPLQSRDVSALIVPEYIAKNPAFTNDASVDDIKKIADKSGIRAGTPKELASPKMQALYKDFSESLNNVVQSKFTGGYNGPIYDTLPKYIQDRIHPDWVDIAIGEKDGSKILLDGLWKHKQAAADVASELTAKDSDEVINLLTRGR